jgi:hypothetical protein
VKERVRRDRKAGGDLLQEIALRRQNQESGGFQKGEEVYGEIKSHWAYELNDGNKKDNIRKKNRRMSYVE